MDPRVAKLFEREQIPQRTDAWFAARKRLVTASEAAAVLDIKPFESYRGSPRAELLRAKRAPVHEHFSNVFTEHGQKYEDEARDIYCERTGEEAYEFGLIIHPSIPWLGCSVDGVTNTGKVVEIKCPLTREIKDGYVPEHYYPQVQICMEVCDLDEAVFIQYKPESITWPEPAQFSVTHVPRDKEWFSKAKPILEAFVCELRASPPLPAPAAPRALTPRKRAPKVCLVREDLYG